MNSTSCRTAGLVLGILFAAILHGSGIAASAAESAGKMILTSSDFSAGGNIPTKFTCDGENSSPELKWTEPPAGTKSFALIVDDPDAPAGTWVHWVIYNLPPTARRLAAKMPTGGDLADGSRQGENDFQHLGYGGPCPPPGPAHRYFFKLFALGKRLSLKSGASKADVMNAMKGQILAYAELMGRYKRGSQ